MLRIAFGCDHRGLKPKALAMQVAIEAGHSCEDLGTFTEESVDYPDFAAKVGRAVADGECDAGVLICDTGIGMSIAANKVKGIRAALCHDAFDAERSRLHNNANVLCMSGRTDENITREIVNIFLKTGFEGGRHQRRVDKIMALESR